VRHCIVGVHVEDWLQLLRRHLFVQLEKWERENRIQVSCPWAMTTNCSNCQWIIEKLSIIQCNNRVFVRFVFALDPSRATWRLTTKPEPKPKPNPNSAVFWVSSLTGSGSIRRLIDLFIVCRRMYLSISESNDTYRIGQEAKTNIE